MEYFNPHSNKWLQNKFEIYKDLRKQDTAYFSEKYQMHILTRYADVAFALNNPDIFSSAKGNLIVESPFRFGMTLGASDKPRHDFYKDIVKNAYSKDNITSVVTEFKSYARELLADHNIDLSDVIDYLSARVSTEIIGLPCSKQEVTNLIVDIQRKASPCVAVNVDNNSWDTMHESYLKKFIFVDKATATQPGIYKEFMTYWNTSTEDFRNVGFSLFTGPMISGASSMSGALQFLTLDLYTNGLIDTLLADRSLIPNAVNEALRYRASTGRFSRTVTTDITMHGVSLKPGDRVAVCLESANRDPEKFDNPDTFDLQRSTSGHLGFGHGVHACIAMAVSKAIMTAYLEVLLDFGKYQVTTSSSDYQYVMTASGNDDMISNLIIKKV